MTLSGNLEGVIDCPKPVEFCRLMSNPSCPNTCSGHGTCIKGKCLCDPGYVGFDCHFIEGQDQSTDCIWPQYGNECKIRQNGCYFRCNSNIF